MQSGKVQDEPSPQVVALDKVFSAEPLAINTDPVEPRPEPPGKPARLFTDQVSSAAAPKAPNLT